MSNFDTVELKLNQINACVHQLNRKFAKLETCIEQGQLVQYRSDEHLEKHQVTEPKTHSGQLSIQANNSFDSANTDDHYSKLVVKDDKFLEVTQSDDENSKRLKPQVKTHRKQTFQGPVYAKPRARKGGGKNEEDLTKLCESCGGSIKNDGQPTTNSASSNQNAVVNNKVNKVTSDSSRVPVKHPSPTDVSPSISGDKLDERDHSKFRDKSKTTDKEMTTVSDIAIIHSLLHNSHTSAKNADEKVTSNGAVEDTPHRIDHLTDSKSGYVRKVNSDFHKVDWLDEVESSKSKGKTFDYGESPADIADNLSLKADFVDNYQVEYETVKETLRDVYLPSDQNFEFGYLDNKSYVKTPYNILVRCSEYVETNLKIVQLVRQAELANTEFDKSIIESFLTVNLAHISFLNDQLRDSDSNLDKSGYLQRKGNQASHALQNGIRSARSKMSSRLKRLKKSRSSSSLASDATRNPEHDRLNSNWKLIESPTYK